jgi:hypothetical protein
MPPLFRSNARVRIGRRERRFRRALCKALHQDGAMETKAYKSAISIVAKMQALSALPKRTGFLAVF